jgi:zeta-carotene desaturase
MSDQEGVAVQVVGQRERFDYLLLAVPHHVLGKLLLSDGKTATAGELLSQVSKFESSPITGIHLWFDREITELEHAVLLDRTIQWLFQKSKLQPDRPESGPGGSYIELVVSSSKSLVDKPRQEIIDLALHELAEFFPAVREAKLEKATVVKELHATYSALPGSDAYRPSARSPWPRVLLAGDWTASGWPATMEGAIRSGYGAAQLINNDAGAIGKFVVPDMKPTGLMKLLS